MPNNANARREKEKKMKDKKKRTVPPPLHKEDKASMDSSSLSLFLLQERIKQGRIAPFSPKQEQRQPQIFRLQNS